MAKDKFHDAVKNALIKEGWTVTDDPLFLQFGGVDLFVDLGAENIIAAQKDN
jgi:XisH protein